MRKNAQEFFEWEIPENRWLKSCFVGILKFLFPKLHYSSGFLSDMQVLRLICVGQCLSIPHFCCLRSHTFSSWRDQVDAKPVPNKHPQRKGGSFLRVFTLFWGSLDQHIWSVLIKWHFRFQSVLFCFNIYFCKQCKGYSPAHLPSFIVEGPSIVYQLIKPTTAPHKTISRLTVRCVYLCHGCWMGFISLAGLVVTVPGNLWFDYFGIVVL